MNGALEEALLRAVDEITDAVRPWLAPAVEAEVARQLTGDPTSSGAPPMRTMRSENGLRLKLSVCGLGQKARTLIAVEAMAAVENAMREHLENLVRAAITRQRPVSEQAQKEFDEWAAASRGRAACYSKIAEIRLRGRRLAAREVSA